MYTIKSIVPLEDESDSKFENDKPRQKLFNFVYKNGIYWVYHYKSNKKTANISDKKAWEEFPHSE